jgi:hypothetical protein
MLTGRSGAAAPAATPVVVSYGPGPVNQANRSEDNDSSCFLESDALADVAVSLVRDQVNNVRLAIGAQVSA